MYILCFYIQNSFPHFSGTYGFNTFRGESYEEALNIFETSLCWVAHHSKENAFLSRKPQVTSQKNDPVKSYNSLSLFVKKFCKKIAFINSDTFYYELIVP